MEFFGLIAFCMVIALYSKVHRLERILRANGLRPVGRTVELTLEANDGDIMGKQCRVLDADETWALVRANEGKKSECETLIRLDSVKQIKVK